MRNRPDTAETDVNGLGAGSARSTAAATAGEAAATPGELHNFIADIEDLVTSMTTLKGEELAAARAKLSERVSAARESLSEVGDEISHRARSAAHDADQYVRENPWQAIGIGAALGLLIGMLVARRN